MKRNLIFLAILFSAVSAFSAEYYVDASRPDDSGAATNWATAKQTIQAAVDLTTDGDSVWVTNGTYLLSSEIAVTNAITIQSVNGPEVTIIEGSGSNRCFNLGQSSCLINGFTITKGKAIGENWPDYRGGGVYCRDFYPVVSNCVIRVNSAKEDGGGMYSGTAYNCIFIGNSAGESGGGMDYGKAYNCAFSRNIAGEDGGGKSGGWASNCTFTGNEVSGRWNDSRGGGMSGGNAYNCIAMHNTAMGVRDDFRGTRVSYCCAPDLVHGVDGNITNAPLLISLFHIATNSPCIGAGSATYAYGLDLSGNAWQDPPSMGCDEAQLPICGPIHLSMFGESELCVGMPYSYLFSIRGNVTRTVVEFDDGNSDTNAVWITHTWSTPGIYQVRLTAFNDDHPQGVSVTKMVTVYSEEESAVYVSDLNGNDDGAGRSWADAKKTIQAGINEQNIKGGIIWVSSGIYSISSEIFVEKAVRVMSVDGPEFTIVDGNQSNRCFNLAGSECLIKGFTITRGAAVEETWAGVRGGGVYCHDINPVVSDCIIINNEESEYGGGMYNGTAQNCEFIGNWADKGGGGLYGGKALGCAFSFNTTEGNGGAMSGGDAYNCTFVANSANGTSSWDGGGAMSGGNAYNCIAWNNTSRVNGENFYQTGVKYSCSSDLTNGVDGNITNAPLLASASHISTNSPCVEAGSSLYLSGVDIDGEAWTSSPSMGCDEPHKPVAGSMNVSVFGDSQLCVGFAGTYLVDIRGAVTHSILNFGDGRMATNIVWAEHSWNVPGTYELTVTAFNDDYPEGISTSMTVVVSAEEESAIYVSDLTGNDDFNGESWTNAKKTIQAGVNQQKVLNGIVWVSNGTYFVSSEILVDKPVRIMSAKGPDVTIVDGCGSNRCFNLSGECLVSGFTVTNGYAFGEHPYDEGGGIVCEDSRSVVSNCLIIGNRVGGYEGSDGGGMSGGTAIDCVFRGNIAGSGGGLYGGEAINCLFISNEAQGSGPLFGNIGSFGGGGLSYGVANRCVFADNSASWDGGGMQSGSAYNCTFSGNTAGYAGGGASLTDVYNSLFFSNSTYEGGGLYGGSAFGCTFVENIAGSGAGVSGAWWGETSKVVNCIFSENLDGYGVGTDTTSAFVYNSCSAQLTHGLDGNITNAPLFIDAANGDFRLQSNSPCINWGNNLYATNATNATDLDGNSRIVEGTVDMGAYEYQGVLGLTDSDGDQLPDDWERQFGGNQDPDRMGANNINSIRQAYIAGLDPTDPDSRFRASLDSDQVLRWNATSGRVYSVWCSTNLLSGFQCLETNIPWTAGQFDGTTNTSSQIFYKIDVQLEEDSGSSSGGADQNNPPDDGGDVDMGDSDMPAVPV